MTSGVYEILNTASGKRYVGSTVNLTRRERQHFGDLRRGVHRNLHLQSAWNKYGAHAFVFRHVMACSVSDLLVWEQVCTNNLKPEYNICVVAGSVLGVKHTVEARANRSRAMCGKRQGPRPLEWRKNMALAQIGKTMSPESRVKMSEAKRGKKRPPFSDATKAKLSFALKGRNLSPEHLANLRTAQKTRRAREQELHG